jgi:8-hydroxy-5-deazaflavin:NADPH oxidoreductase
MKVAIVGGTGSFGRALAKRLHEIGKDEVLVGSRDEARAQATAAELGVEGGSNEEIVKDADLVVLAVKSNAALETARELADAIGETPVLCVASDLCFTEDGVLPGRESRSLAEELAEAIAAPIASGLQSVSAVELAGREPPDQDALVCGNDDGAKQLALELAGKVVAGRAVDAGPLANSRALEAMTAVILNVNKQYKAHAGVRLTGLP